MSHYSVHLIYPSHYKILYLQYTVHKTYLLYNMQQKIYSVGFIYTKPSSDYIWTGYYELNISLSNNRLYYRQTKAVSKIQNGVEREHTVYWRYTVKVTNMSPNSVTDTTRLKQHHDYCLSTIMKSYGGLILSSFSIVVEIMFSCLLFVHQFKSTV